MTLAEIATKLNFTSGFLTLPAAIFMTDAAVFPDPLQVMKSLPRGSAVILRDYDKPDRVDWAIYIQQVCQHMGLRFVVAGDIGLARQLGADGIHVPRWQHSQMPRLRYQWPRGWMTASAHTVRELRNIGRHGIDAALLSPVFPTESHAETRHLAGRTLGVVRMGNLLQISSVPVYALGGMTSRNAARLQALKGPLAGIAAIRGWDPIAE
ncbi:MAG: thiamine phosphate synthase [Kordiimonas sp.]|nr:thiamine phosphate synthase [Kordiimonas sp.]